MRLSSLFCLLFSLLASVVYAQDRRKFQWQFGADAISTSLPTCQELPIIVKSFNADNSTQGTPPYYMTSFAINGVPTTTLLGNDSLSWTVTQPVGSKLLLGVIDSTQGIEGGGGSGGIPPRIFTVVAGQSTQCVKTPAPSTFTVSANVTDKITTCQPWGIRVKGGVPPYTITLAQPNSPVVTNVTFSGINDDAFTFIDRADTNSQIMAAISDFTGAWANGTVLVDTVGPADVSCTGLVSSSGNSTQLDLDSKNQASSQAASKKKQRDITIGVVVPLTILLIAGLVVLFIFLRRRKPMGEKVEIDAYPRQYDVPFTSDQAQAVPAMPKSPSDAPSSPPSGGEFDPYVHGGYQSRRSNTSSSRPGFTTFPANTQGRVRSKGSEAALDAARARAELASEGGSSAARSMSASSSRVTGSRRDDLPALPGQEEIIIQHRDGGQPVVRELPPPYADRSRRSLSESEVQV